MRRVESIRGAILDYVKKTYGVEPDYPFSGSPDTPVLRHAGSRKWFGIIMAVDRGKLGLPGEGQAEVLDLKCSPILSGALRSRPGFLPAWHMNRDNWISVLLDGTVPPEEVYPLVDLSFGLTGAGDGKKGTAWLVPANPRYFDIAAEIRRAGKGTFLWKQTGRVKKGDAVFLYLAAPVSGIVYRCRAEETDIPFRFADGPVRMTKVMRLRALTTYDPPIPLETLREHGVSTVRGPRYMPLSLQEELERPGRRKKRKTKEKDHGESGSL